LASDSFSSLTGVFRLPTLLPARRKVPAFVKQAGCPAFLDQAVLAAFDRFCWR
jgi:hypothetical protein